MRISDWSSDVCSSDLRRFTKARETCIEPGIWTNHKPQEQQTAALIGPTQPAVNRRSTNVTPGFWHRPQVVFRVLLSRTHVRWATNGRHARFGIVLCPLAAVPTRLSLDRKSVV